MSQQHPDYQETMITLRRIFDPAHAPEALAQAEEILRRTAERFEADIATLFVVRGDRLVLSAGLALLGDEEIQLPREHEYRLPPDWDAEASSDSALDLTCRAVVTGEPVWIDSRETLKEHRDHLSPWDGHAYPDGVDHPTNGFGCLYGVPLRTSVTDSPRDSVIGIFKIERRSSARPFSDAERLGFDIVAQHLSALLRAGAKRSERGASVPEEVAGSFLAILKRQEVRDLAPALAADPSSSVASAVASRTVFDVAELMAETERGFAALTVEDELKKSALRNLHRWLGDDVFADYHDQLAWLIEAGRWPLLLDSFYRVLPFGTGGRRGPVGIGPNRFNPFTLASSVAGHADFLRECFPDEDLSVVIVFDVRCFSDLKKNYSPATFDPSSNSYRSAVPNPLLNLSSRDFARIASEVYSAMSVRTYLPEDDANFVSTPELSYAIRALGASAGLNISASHNHPDDNGGKFYNRLGAQHVPPSDGHMAQRVENVHPRSLARVPFERAVEAGRVERIPSDVHDRYVAMNVSQSLRPEERSARVVFTPLHGTGTSTVGEVLVAAGFDVSSVEAQATADGSFPKVPFRAPNPEVRESMDLGVAQARQSSADLVMATDPDADRIGVCALSPSGDYEFLNGNEIAAVVTHYKLDQLKRLGRLPAKPIVVKTEVTTELLRPIVENYGGVLIGDLLVGFKYHGNVLEQLELGVKLPFAGACLEDFVIGVEESHGILVTPEVRDKDAAGAAILLAELASMLKTRGETLPDYLAALHKQFGVYANVLTSMVMTGAEGLQSIQRIQEVLRNEPPERIAGFAVSEFIDHRSESGIYGPIVSDTDRASRDVLVFRLENGARLIIRPSGTEPKSKVYIELPRPPLGPSAEDAALQRERAEAGEIAQQIADAFTHHMLSIIDVKLSNHALRISGLVPLEYRIDFDREFLPQLEERAARVLDGTALRESASSWIDEHLASYGNDARGLVDEALRAFLSFSRAQQDGPPHALLEVIEALFFDAPNPGK